MTRLLRSPVPHWALWERAARLAVALSQCPLPIGMYRAFSRACELLRLRDGANRPPREASGHLRHGRNEESGLQAVRPPIVRLPRPVCVGTGMCS